MDDILDAVLLALIWVANGGLVVVFWLLDHLLLLAVVPALYLLAAGARPFIQERFR